MTPSCSTAISMSEFQTPDSARLISQLSAVRPRLVVFFSARGCGAESEDLASETIARVLSHVSARRPIRDLGAFTYGVARIVRLEHMRNSAPVERVDPEALGDLAAVSPLRAEDARHGVVLECLRDLPPQRLSEFVEYHLGPGPNARRRAAMAARLGISQGALQSRISATRLALRREIAGRLARGQESQR